MNIQNQILHAAGRCTRTKCWQGARAQSTACCWCTRTKYCMLLVGCMRTKCCMLLVGCTRTKCCMLLVGCTRTKYCILLVGCTAQNTRHFLFFFPSCSLFVFCFSCCSCSSFLFESCRCFYCSTNATMKSASTDATIKCPYCKIRYGRTSGRVQVQTRCTSSTTAWS